MSIVLSFIGCFIVLCFEYKIKFLVLRKMSLNSFLLLSNFIETICSTVLYALGGIIPVTIYCGVLMFRYFHHKKIEGYVDKNESIKVSDILTYFINTNIRVPQIILIIVFAVSFDRIFDRNLAIYNFLCCTNIINNLVFTMFTSKNFREKVSR